VNVIAPIFTNREGLFLQSIYHPLRLYAEHVQEVALDVSVNSDTYDLRENEVASLPHSVADLEASRPYRVAELGPFKLLDVTATCDANGHELMLAVVNRDRDRAHPTTIQLTDAATMTNIVAYEVNGADPDTVNSFEQPHSVYVQEHRLDQKGQNISYTFAPHSLTLLCVHLA
jgi:alpha-N-arabinofuranosidase